VSCVEGDNLPVINKVASPEGENLPVINSALSRGTASLEGDNLSVLKHSSLTRGAASLQGDNLPVFNKVALQEGWPLLRETIYQYLTKWPCKRGSLSCRRQFTSI
jgi:hypothetical protein